MWLVKLDEKGVSVLLENNQGSIPTYRTFRTTRIYETLIVAQRKIHFVELTLTTLAGDDEIEQITKQVNKLVEVVRW